MFFHCFSEVNWRWRYGLYTSLVLKIDFCFLLLATGSYSKNRLAHAFDAILGLYGTLCYVQYYISGLAIVGFVFVNQIHDLLTSYTCACIETCCRARTNSKGFYRCMFSLFPHVILYNNYLYSLIEFIYLNYYAIFLLCVCTFLCSFVCSRLFL